MKKTCAVPQVSLAALENEWQRRATGAAIEAARRVVQVDGPIPPLTPIGRLGDSEWGWIIAAVLFGWIRVRSEQAAAENLDTEQTIRLTGLDPEPWDIGAIMAILPELADACPKLDWSFPLSAWSRETITGFLLKAFRLTQKAMLARDLSDRGVTRKSRTDVIAREANAASGGPLMTPDEYNEPLTLSDKFDDDIPF